MNNIPQWLEEEIKDYVIELAVAPQTILDIGANIGSYTKYISTVYPHALIHAYEPLPDNCARFAQNISSPNIQLHPVAIRRFAGKSDLYLGDLFVTNSFYRLGRQTNRVLTVDCLTAKELPAAELIKMDVEGSEWEIIQEIDLTACRGLVVECHMAEYQSLITSVVTHAGLSLTEVLPSSNTCAVLKFIR